jgi:hypothetical protein
MFSRGRRSVSHIRRPGAPFGAARAPKAEIAASRMRSATAADLAFERSVPERYSEIDPLGELQRILALRLQMFRLQFFAVANDRGQAVLAETEIEAPDASAAIRAAADADWPPRAIGLRLLDSEGREIFERLKADRR